LVHTSPSVGSVPPIAWRTRARRAVSPRRR
jgi:hypothetical protein